MYNLTRNHHIKDFSMCVKILSQGDNRKDAKLAGLWSSEGANMVGLTKACYVGLLQEYKDFEMQTCWDIFPPRKGNLGCCICPEGINKILDEV